MGQSSDSVPFSRRKPACQDGGQRRVARRDQDSRAKLVHVPQNSRKRQRGSLSNSRSARRPPRVRAVQRRRERPRRAAARCPDNFETGISSRFSRPSQASNSGNIPCDVALRRSGNAQRQGDMSAYAPILDDPGCPETRMPTRRRSAARKRATRPVSLAEKHQAAAAGPLGEGSNPQQRRLARPAGPGQQAEPAGIQRQRDVGQDRRAGIIPLSDMFEPHHSQYR